MTSALGGERHKTVQKSDKRAIKQPKMQDNLNRVYPRDFVMIRND